MTSRTVRRAGALALGTTLTLAACSGGHAATGPGTLTGTVTVTGVPAGATIPRGDRVVTIDKLPAAGLAGAIPTDANGHFSQQIPAGKYGLIPSCAGKAGPSQIVKVRTGRTTTVTLVCAQ